MGGRSIAVGAMVLILSGGPAAAVTAKGKQMSYAQAKAFLAAHTQVLELTDGRGARVAVCPQWQGRVMTSTCDGPQGRSFGFIHREFIERGKPDLKFNNYGGEDRMWLSPEGGQFSLWFKPGQAQRFDHWFTPPALNEGAWTVAFTAPAALRMTHKMQFQNASATAFDLDVARDVRLLEPDDLAALFGPVVSATLQGPTVKLVGYETVNAVTNRGAAMSDAQGLVSIWILGMLNAGPRSVIIVPYRPGDEAVLGPVVKSDYFGAIPPERLKILPEAILLRADAQWRSKIGTSQRRACNVLGSIDFEGGVLTIVQFSMPEDPAKVAYMNNMWALPQAHPYRGDVANSYNDGPTEPGKPGMGNFYEIESLSPAARLKTGDSLAHHHRTLHIQADLPVLARLAKEILGVDLEAVRQAMLPDR
jgi:hypothetical protein